MTSTTAADNTPAVHLPSQIEHLATATLVPYARNSRTHSPEQVAAVARSIQQFGFTNPVLIDAHNTIIAGHGRIMAAQQLGLATVPCIRLAHLTDAQRRAYVIADNKLAELSGWDMATLAREVEDLMHEEFDVDLLGFGADELQALLHGEQEQEQESQEQKAAKAEKVPEIQAQEVTQTGDVWVLGKHRVMCGDGTSQAAVVGLLAGVVPDMVFTDPPYGISHSGKGITAGGVEGNDFGEIMGDGDVRAATDSFRLCCFLFPDARLIFWGANYYPSALPDGHGWLVWDKQREGDIFSGAELAFVNGGVRLDVFRHMWHGMVKASEHGQKRVHPTQKPVALAEWCFERYGKPGGTVLDLFGGSGTTLIACENTKRVARLMELDPKYCDVIINRWQAFTGNQAKLEATGQTFAQVQAQRVGTSATA